MVMDAQSPLPPLSTLPTSTYPPSSYPPPSYFESVSVIHPALLLPSKRTGEIQKKLGELVFQQPKRKRVYPPEEGLDFTKEDLEAKYDPRKERKLVLTRLGPDAANDGVCFKEIEGDSEELRESKKDKVWTDPRVSSLLESATKDSTANDDDNAIGSTAPSGKCCVRLSYIKLSATPYSLLTVDQVLRRILPTSENTNNSTLDNSNDGDYSKRCGDATDNPIVEEIPSSFEIAGHIAHVNLKNESLPYKYLVGRAILEKNRPKIKMVVNKIGTIENEFRTYPMEILAGEGLDAESTERLCAGEGGEVGGEGGEVQVKIGPQHRSLMQVEVREHGCRFKLDFARVYFNSRLQGEHARLVKQIVKDAKKSNGNDMTKECIVVDAMAGVGPFAVPLTSANASHFRETRIVCHANDLNPVSYEYLHVNARGNRCFMDRLMMYNLDARLFIRKMNEEGVGVDHFIMNLPQLAPEFLDAFRGWKFRGDGKRPVVHVHCFGEKARTAVETALVERQVQERCEKALGCPGRFSESITPEDEFRVHVVRDVGPRKNMLCVSFRLPHEVGGLEKIELPNAGKGSSAEESGAAGNSSKRDRTDESGSFAEAESHDSKRNKE